MIQVHRPVGETSRAVFDLIAMTENPIATDSETSTATMNIWGLAVLCTFVWLLWLVGSVLQLHADQLEGKASEDAGVSIMPTIPVLPIGAVLLALVIDQFAAPWGVRVMAVLHGLIALAFLFGIVNVIRRIRSTKK